MKKAIGRYIYIGGLNMVVKIVNERQKNGDFEI